MREREERGGLRNGPDNTRGPAALSPYAAEGASQMGPGEGSPDGEVILDNPSGLSAVTR